MSIIYYTTEKIMELVKKLDTGAIYKKRNGKYGIKNKQNKWVNGDEKVKILLAEGLIKAPVPKAKEEPVEEAPAEETPVEETTEE